jgi:DNA polymerase-4
VLLVELVERVTKRLREGQRTARTLELRWRDQEMDSHTMSATLDHPTNDTATLLLGAQKLLDDAWPAIGPAGLGLLGFSVANLSERQAVQLGFDFTGRDRTELDSTLDAVHARFGDGAITRGSLLGRTLMETPVLPGTATED